MEWDSAITEQDTEPVSAGHAPPGNRLGVEIIPGVERSSATGRGEVICWRISSMSMIEPFWTAKGKPVPHRA